MMMMGVQKSSPTGLGEIDGRVWSERGATRCHVATLTRSSLCSSRRGSRVCTSTPRCTHPTLQSLNHSHLPNDDTHVATAYERDGKLASPLAPGQAPALAAVGVR